MSLWISDSFTKNNLCEVVRGIAGDLVEEVKLIDNFTNKKGMTSHCYRIAYRSTEWSPTDDEINGYGISNMNRKRGAHSLVVLNEKLYAIGGHDGDKMVLNMEIYDPRAVTWTAGEPMNQSRGYLGASIVKDTIYAIGGITSGSDIVDLVCMKCLDCFLTQLEYMKILSLPFDAKK